MKARSTLRHGFTLAEIMVTISVLAIFSALAMPVFINSLRSLSFTTNRICLNRDFRALTNRLMKDGRAAGQFILYESFSDNPLKVATSSSSGNYLVLLTLDSNGCYITKSTGYFRHTDGTVRHFTVAEPGNSAVPKNLPAASTAATHPVVVEFARDYSDTNDRLFFNKGRAGIVIYGQIRDDGKVTINTTQSTRPAVSTYNFTITPRG